ncbi:transposable element Tcb1 transposase [Trichonephila clavipes]|nr:transposable element Tcb1 transposase [Trichonephila clavipes]
MPLRRFRRQYGQLSQFERVKIIGMMEAGWSVKLVARHLGHSDCVVKRSRSERCHLHEDQAQDALDRPSRRGLLVEKTTTSFNLSSDDNRVRVWRPRGEHLKPAFTLQRHTTLTAGVVVLGAIAYNTRSHP